MRLVVFSDVHGNLPALELMLQHAKDADGYICLGDVVNYGPWSNECVDLITALPGIILVEGNHERYFNERLYTGQSDLARTFFNVCYPTFDRYEQISGLSESYALESFTMRHTIDDEYIYHDSPITLDGNYIIGHTHRQFQISQPPFTLYNTGSVGQNREYIDLINYLAFDSATRKVELCSVTYDPRVVIREMKLRGYPDICVDYYANKPKHYG